MAKDLLRVYGVPVEKAEDICRRTLPDLDALTGAAPVDGATRTYRWRIAAVHAKQVAAGQIRGMLSPPARQPPPAEPACRRKRHSVAAP
ncbi:MAG: hypothetical protein ACLP3C_14845, partial [Mycobacterium sp.]